ncbi:MAG: SDR family oxidoreductase [Xanthobacteraceae bacterium]
MIRFDGRVAVVTGAGGGLGKSHALMLSSRGAKVVVNDLGGKVDGRGASQGMADAVVAEIRAAGGDAVANYDSVATAEGGRKIIQTAIDAFGKVDILINNAGFLRDRTFAKMELADFEAVLQTHLMGAVYCTKAAWSHMRERRYGRIVMTSSGAGLYGNFGQANYGTAKMGVIGLMNVLKLEGARDGILVNAIAPIATTRMTEAGYPKDVLSYLRPDFVSAAVAFLCSETFARSGEIISAGGGYIGRAALVESEGVFVDVNRPADVDEVAQLFDRFADMSRASGFPSAEEYTKKAFARLLPAVE